MFSKKRKKESPVISTASLPDIVFMLLFFFMVATVMRKNTVMVTTRLPQADQSEKLEKRDLSMYVYIGKPMEVYQNQFGSEVRIQLNDKFASPNEIKDFVFSERAARREEQIPFLTAVLKIDSESTMGIISDVKKELRKAEQYRINYLAQKGSSSKE